jgi:general secretion pathway protein E
MGIGTILLERGMITRAQLEEALAIQKRDGSRLDRALVKLGFVSQDDVLKAIGEQFDMPIIDLAGLQVDRDILDTLPAKLVFKQRCVPIEQRNGTLRVATCDPFELTAFDELRLLTGMAIELVLADERDLRKFIRAHYGVAGDILDELTADDDAASEFATQDLDSSHEEIEEAQAASVIKLVNDLLVEAVRERATDVHIEPYEDSLSIRYRIDGVLTQAGVPPTVNRFRNAIISRLKIMANLNIAEKRKPQDGRIGLRLQGQEYDLRVSVIPMIYGEGVVLRILNKSAAMIPLTDLGMDQATLDRWDEFIARPHGILLVTGPTGSGKTTTLYASLQRIVSDAVKAITVEDPVEYNLHGVNQIHVNRQVQLDFAAGLRAILRHDPDVIMIGEIRDLETAEAAVQASLTGHLVFSTLHTNDAAGAVTRLQDMGVEPYLVASSVQGVLAQRLVRRICPQCAEKYEPSAADVPDGLELEPGEELTRGHGCRHCRQTGYRGRVGIFELLRANDDLREMVMNRENANRIANTALKSGMLQPLHEDGFAKVRLAMTTAAEVLRAAQT